MKEITEHEKHMRELMKRNSEIRNEGGYVKHGSIELIFRESDKIEESKRYYEESKRCYEEWKKANPELASEITYDYYMKNSIRGKQLTEEINRL